MAQAGPHEQDARPAPGSTTTETIPVLVETAHISKRVVETGKAVIRKTVSERDAVVDALLDRHDVTVERVPIGRAIEQAPAARQDGDTWIFPIVEEILVVEKRLILKEELHIRTTTRQEPVQKTVRLRTEHVVVEQTANAPEAGGLAVADT